MLMYKLGTADAVSPPQALHSEEDKKASGRITHDQNKLIRFLETKEGFGQRIASLQSPLRNKQQVITLRGSDPFKIYISITEW